MKGIKKNMEKEEKRKMGFMVFDFFMIAKEEDLIELGDRLGEKMDTVDPWEEFLIPLCKGMLNGSLFKPDELKKFLGHIT